MKQDGKEQKRQGKKSKKLQLYKPRKKKSVEEDAAIQYLQAQYDKINPDEIKTFKDFPLSQKTLKGLKENHYVTPTEIQKQAIGYALQGKDILGAAKTGSGKTLAFLIPILENLFCKKWTRLDGVGALVISPTRELAYQIYEALRKVGHLHDFSAGLIIGGQNLKFERKRMDQINILICTPGRLLQHMDENPLFDCSHLQILVLDEADRCLDMGFEATMNAIIENLPPERQTLLFSATQTKSVKDLARLSLSFPTYIAPHEQAATVTPDLLQQSYIITEIEDKIGILWSFIKNHLKQKVIVFMATCKQVKYIYELFCKLRPGVSLLALYGTLHQEKREKIYNEFCRKSNVVLFATDLASRGLDFPRVNWVIQMDCPEDVETYIHRAGRTARGFTGKGEGLLMLLPHEEKFVEHLQNSKIPINKIQVDPSKVIAPQKKIETLLSDSMELKQSAQRAFVSYLKSVFLMKNKEIFNVQLLDTDSYARSLGLIVPPYIKFLKKQQYAQKKQENNNVIEKLKAKTESDKEDSDQSEEEVTDINVEKKPEKQKIKERFVKFDFHNVKDTDGKDFFQGNNFDIQLSGELLEEPQVESTKVAVVKKLLKKNITINKTVKFTEEGEVDEEENKDVDPELLKQISSANSSNLHFEKTQMLMQDEDKIDKVKFRESTRAKHKEKKRKLKNKRKEDEGEKDDFGSQSESDGPDLSWLPDPDKIYGKEDGRDNSGDSGEDRNSEASDGADYESGEDRNSEVSDEANHESGDDSEVEENFHRPTKRKLLETQASVPRKVKKVQDISASLSVSEAEALAMQLLQTKR
ncbi:unnamed protein product [Spodoptera littoralis]|uniref:ATP-dependent RNA helicase n=1 Tax=Spodoptera littoralis TaxID=7109 RepID=A0A9P0HZJ8_SPOLI|nr:unnamed protein product [Spodoptera littoralis]CAH1636675.1 unnamed protein product [Spodoptera littoralis]